MANAEFLKKLGLKPHVPSTPAVSESNVLAKPVASATPVRADVPANPAPSPAPKAPAGAGIKAQGLTFKIGGKSVPTSPVAAQESGGDSPRVPDNESGRAGDVAAVATVPSKPVVESPTDSPNSVPTVINVGPTTDSFQALLDQFDAMVGQVGNITQLELDQSRNFVASIMKDLVTHPELDGLVIDRDVHNIMKFVQASSGMANKNFVTSQERKQKSADKKAAAAAINLDVFEFGADVDAQMAAIKAKKGIPATKAIGIADLSAMNIDDIEAKNRR